MANIPAELKYTASHEWVRVEGHTATIGITDFAQSELGDVVYVELPAVGKTLAKGETFGSVESVKTVSDIYAPVSGVVIAANGSLGSQSDLINSDPFGAGFLIQLQMNDPSELGGLLTSEGYASSIA